MYIQVTSSIHEFPSLSDNMNIPAMAVPVHTVSISQPLPRGEAGREERGYPRSHSVGMTTQVGVWSATRWSEVSLATSRDPISVLLVEIISF